MFEGDKKHNVRHFSKLLSVASSAIILGYTLHFRMSMGLHGCVLVCCKYLKVVGFRNE